MKIKHHASANGTRQHIKSVISRVLPGELLLIGADPFTADALRSCQRGFHGLKFSVNNGRA